MHEPVPAGESSPAVSEGVEQTAKKETVATREIQTATFALG